MAGDEVVMAPSSEMMIHEPMGLAVGGAADMAKMAEDLAHEADNLAAHVPGQALAARSTQWREVMRAETWYSAQEAVAAGLADRVAETSRPPPARQGPRTTSPSSPTPAALRRRPRS